MFFGNHTIFPPSPPEKIAIYLRMSAAGIYVLHPHQLPYNGFSPQSVSDLPFSMDFPSSIMLTENYLEIPIKIKVS